MTDNDTSDANGAQRIPLTRRQALAGIGAGLLTGAGAAGSTAQDETLTERQAQWTARRRERVSATATDRTVAGVSSAVEETLPDVQTNKWELRDLSDSIVEETARASIVETEEIPLDTIDTTSQLQYVGVQWDEYSNPTPDTGDDGAWKHTFVLSTVAAAQRLDPEATWDAVADDVEYTADRLQYRPHPTVKVQPGLRVMATADAEYDEIHNPWNEQSHTVDEDVPDQTDGDDQGQEHVAISARRDKDLFGFGSPQSLAEQVDGETVMRDLMNQVATAPTEAIADYAALRRSMYRAAERRSNVKAMGRIVGGLAGIAGAAGARDGVTGPLEDTAEIAEDGEVEPGEVLEAAVLPEFSNKYTEKLSTAAAVTGDIQELMDEPEYDKTAREFYHGFDQFLDGAGPYSLGYVMFDVYVAPGKTGRVDVSVANRFTQNAAPEVTDVLDDYPVAAQTWRLEFEGLPPEAEAGDPTEDQLYNAEIVASDFTVSKTDGDEDHSYLSYLEHRDRPTRPGPSILPRTDGEPGVADRVAAGDRPTFSAHDSTLSTGPITSHSWSIHQLREADDGDGLVPQPAYQEAPDGGPTFSPEIEAPGPEDAGTQRVVLTVESDEGSASTEFDFSVGAPSAPEPTIETSPEEPTVVDTLSFEADAEMPGEQVTYAWDLVGHPSELDTVPEYVYQGSGREYSIEPPVEGSYTVSLWVSDDLGAEASTTTTVSVADGFAVSIDGPGEVAPGQSTTYEASVTGDVTVQDYEWELFGETDTGSSASATFESGDDATVSVTATAADGTTASASLTPSVQDMTVVLDGPSTLQVGETGQVEATVTGAESDLNYAFDNADQVNSSARDSPTRPVTFEDVGTETVSVTAVEVGDDNERASDSIEIDVVESSPLSIEGPSSVSVGESVSFDAVGGPLDASYEWELFGETASGQTVSATYENGDEPVVSVTATGPDGATASDTTHLDVTGSTPTYGAEVLEGEPSLDSLGFHVHRADGRVVVRSNGDGGDGDYYRFDVSASGGTISDVQTDNWNSIESIDASADDRVTGSGRVAGAYDQFSFETDADALAFDLEFSDPISGKPSPSEVETQPRPDLVHLGGDRTNPDAVPFRVELDGADSVGPIDGFEPTDQDGDGLYEDVTGDGTVGQTDVVTFFRHQHRDDWKRTEWFDFTGNGTVGHGDVIELFETVATQ